MTRRDHRLCNREGCQHGAQGAAERDLCAVACVAVQRERTRILSRVRAQAIQELMTIYKCRLCQHRWDKGQPESHAPTCAAEKTT